MSKYIFGEIMPESAKSTSVLEINQLLFLWESKPRLLQTQIPTARLGSVVLLRQGEGHRGLSPLTYLSALLSLAPGIFQGLAVREMTLTLPGLLHIFCLRSGYFLWKLKIQNLTLTFMFLSACFLCRYKCRMFLPVQGKGSGV